MGPRNSKAKQNITLSLAAETIRKARILAARRDTSVSGLIAAELEALVRQDEAYESAQRQALALLDHGFHMGGMAPFDRSELHDRKGLR